MFGRAGNGREIKVWSDWWVPKDSSFKVQSTPSCILPENTFVSELMDDIQESGRSSLSDRRIALKKQI